MGSKKSLAPRIGELIGKAHPRAAILDAFSGMCAVAGEVAPKHVVYTNDIHAFAEIIARALFVGPEPAPTSLHARDELMSDFRENAKKLSDALGARLEQEDRALRTLSKPGGWRQFKEFSLCELARRHPMPPGDLAPLEKYQKTPRRFPFCLVTSYFASSYFGLRQSIEIDSLRFAIDRAPSERRDHYLAGLLHAMSHCAAAPGHFAQFFVPRDRANTEYIGRIRSRSILNRFFDSLDAMPRLGCKSRKDNRSFCSDATALLDEKRNFLGRGNLVIYADPPYSRAQYSRYYHVLETTVLYDYPSSSGKGRYREDRSQTDFSHKAQVADAIDNFVAAAASTGGHLYLSYPSNGLLSETGECLDDILATHYPNVELVMREPLKHSTMGGAPGAAAIDVFEDVYYAGWKRPK